MFTSTKRALFIGNSLNRLKSDNDSISWDTVMSKLEEALPDDWKKEQNEHLPLYVRAERLQNLASMSVDNQEEVENRWKEWLTELNNLSGNSFMHSLLSRFSYYFENILTTNYDYAIEKCLGISVSAVECDNMRRRHGKVWHIHGEAGVRNSIIMTRQSYLDNIHLLKESDLAETWLTQFLSSDVYVCGFSMSIHEHTFWYALTQRLKKQKPQARKKIRAFLFCREGLDEEDCDALVSLLKSFDVEVEQITVTKKEKEYCFENAWYELVGRMLQSLIQDDDNRMVGSSSGSSLPDFPEYKLKWNRCNIVTSSTPTRTNPKRVWMNISFNKIEKYKNKSYIFDCLIKGRRYVYSLRVEEMERAFRTQKVQVLENAPRRYSFYLDYQEGAVYSTVSERDRNPIIQLEPVPDSKVYESLRFS